MATQQAFQREPTTSPWSMALDRFQSVGAAGGRKAATRTEQRRDKGPIKTDQSQQQRRKSLIQASPAIGLVSIG
jgi:hypothetical protein